MWTPWLTEAGGPVNAAPGTCQTFFAEEEPGECISTDVANIGMRSMATLYEGAADTPRLCAVGVAGNAMTTFRCALVRDRLQLRHVQGTFGQMKVRKCIPCS